MEVNPSSSLNGRVTCDGTVDQRSRKKAKHADTVRIDRGIARHRAVFHQKAAVIEHASTFVAYERRAPASGLCEIIEQAPASVVPHQAVLHDESSFSIVDGVVGTCGHLDTSQRDRSLENVDPTRVVAKVPVPND
jgi:hypothetical protein